MLSEILLVLSGHPSSFFAPYPSSNPSTLRTTPLIEKYLHPGEISVLNALSHLAFQYTTIHQWATTSVTDARIGLLDLNKKGKGKEKEVSKGCVYKSVLGAGLLDILREYETLIVELESQVLDLDPGIVQDDLGYVPLSLLMTTFQPWTVPFSSLFDLVTTLKPNVNPGELLDILSERVDTGHPDLQRIYQMLSSRLEKVWISHLIIFILYGHVPPESSSLQPAMGIDQGSDRLSPRYRVYSLDDRLLPRSVERGTRESILYVGRVIATLKREGREVPRSVIDPLRESFEGLVSISSSRGPLVRLDVCDEEDYPTVRGKGLKDLDRIIGIARRDIGEWLWKYVLTGTQIFEALETYGNYFLTRRADHTTSFIHELEKLHTSRILLSDPQSSSSVIRDTDLHLAWLRCSLGTSAEHDKALDSFHLRFDHGPLRAFQAPSRPLETRVSTTDVDGIKSLFSSFTLGTPVTLHPTVSWPLDLFISPQARTIYSEIHAYLFSLRTIHQRLLTSFRSLTSSRPTLKTRVEGTKKLEREVWAILNLGLFFLDELISHFMVDIIDVQHRTLLSQLESTDDNQSMKRSGSIAASLRGSKIQKSQSTEYLSSRHSVGFESSAGIENGSQRRFERQGSPASTYAAETVRSRIPPTNKHTVHLDFLTLRQIHSRHLAFLRQGLLIADKELAIVVRDILEIFTRVSGLIERWGHSIFPKVQMENIDQEIESRTKAMIQLKKELHEHLSDFFQALVQSQNPSPNGDTSNTRSGSSFSKTTRMNQMVHSSRIMPSRQSSFVGSKVNKGGLSKAEIEKSERYQEAENLMARHVEQLLLRLDFNGVFTSWIAKELDVTRDGILAEGGL